VFSILLPCFALALWLALVVLPGASLYLRVRQELPRSGTGLLTFGQFSVVMSRDRLFAFVFNMQGHNSDVVAGANLPGVSIEVLVSILHRTWPSVWYPTGFMRDSWRALIYPLYCLPFWWFVGRGGDGLMGWRRQHWSLCLIGSAFFLVFASFTVAFQFAPAADRIDFPMWVVYGAGLWDAMFAVFPAAWVRQRTSDRGQRPAEA